MKKILSTISLVGLGTIFAGCATSAAEAMDVTTEIETTEKTIVEQLNTIASGESSLQGEFETTLAEDDDLSSLSDGSAPLFENIETRQTSITSLQEATDELKAHSEELSSIDDSELPQEELTALSDNVTTLTSSLDQFINQYGESLEQQEKYFQSLATEEATYETLETGMEQANENHAANNGLLTEIDSILAQLQSSHSQAAESLNALEESN